MALAGFMHIGPHSHGTHVGHVRVGHSGTGHVGHGHFPKGSHGHQAAQAHGGLRFNLRSLLSFSPLDIFSYCAGAGMAAFLFRPYIRLHYLFIFAIIGALVFDQFVTRAIMNMITRFAASPSTGLEGTVATEGVAVTNFDDSGRGLVKLTLDGQIVQLLATLELTERNSGVRVRKGDSLLIVEVDSVKNRCMVTRELAEDAPERNVLRIEGKS
jgi:hypothetical protein